uniref:Nucleotidyltransferase substrate binding protein, HI0074 family n=1 Tax=Candidatus Kentrum sp. TC TaxID=2126339 RepID=A0A450YEB8_9GAMM|nr:MAG: nucleotidyltransferase substrate binding protein, HI0074 family [Candidatus Kentron sp. TC]VFK57188.1 MAG: nucleotidyltransferase substrate binding protein, HI0074 family [Candidatus Kentron sp. TC]
MPKRPLDLASLDNAIARLGEGLARCLRDTTDDQIRDGLIQRFEFTYEISHKMLRRYLRAISPTPEEVDRMAFADLIRAANERGLLRGDWPVWRGYREMRAKTSHTYDVDVALEVVACIPDFLEEARFLNQRLLSDRGSAQGSDRIMPSVRKPPLDIEPRHLAIVLDILRRHVPRHEVRAFGSRVVGGARPHSDLDLVIMTETPLPFALMGALREGFTKSDLPWRVDIVDWATTNTAFREFIERDGVVIEAPEFTN